MCNGKQASKALKVLLIEGHLHVRTPLEHVLRSRGHDVNALDSGETGLKAITNGRYDAVVCNHHLPSMSGIDFFDRSREALSGATTILTASFADNYLADNALALGITVFLEMPFKIDILLACIEGRTPDLCAGALGRHLYVTSGGQMMAISPTCFAESAAAAQPRRAPLPKAINRSGRRWKLYLNPDAPQCDLNGPDRKHLRTLKRYSLCTGKPLHDLC